MPWQEMGMRELHQLYKDAMVGGMGFYKVDTSSGNRSSGTHKSFLFR